MKYDYLIVGAGLFGATFAYLAKKDGKKVLVIDKRDHIAGNIYTEAQNGINVHKYGAHIFHTNDNNIWEFVNKFATFNRFTNSPIANYHGKIYSLPFNMYTFNQMWGITTPDEALKIINEQRNEIASEPQNLEEQAIHLVGRDIYETLIKGYTQKQWGRNCKDLPAFIIKRLPVRFTYDNNYFDARFQGIPVGGYTKMVENMLNGVDIILNEDYLKKRELYNYLANSVVYTGPIDAYFDYSLGYLEYRSIRFEEYEYENMNYQGNAVVNYTDFETPWTRIIEHKWFEFGKDSSGNTIHNTIISKEFSTEWKTGMEPYYPVNDSKNNSIYDQYAQLASKEIHTVFGGRLGQYKYYDMDAVIGAAFEQYRCFS